MCLHSYFLQVMGRKHSHTDEKNYHAFLFWFGFASRQISSSRSSAFFCKGSFRLYRNDNHLNLMVRNLVKQIIPIFFLMSSDLSSVRGIFQGSSTETQKTLRMAIKTHALLEPKRKPKKAKENQRNPLRQSLLYG